MLSGSGTNRTGPSLVGRRARPSDNYAVQFLNGPGANSADMEDAQTQELVPPQLREARSTPEDDIEAR